MTILTKEDLKPRLNVEDSHQGFLSDFPGFPKADQAQTIRLLATTDPVELFAFAEDEKTEAEGERRNLLRDLLFALPAAPSHRILAQLLACDIRDLGSEDLKNDSGEEISFLDAAVAIADLHSPAPENVTSSRDTALGTAIGNLSGFGGPFRPLIG